MKQDKLDLGLGGRAESVRAALAWIAEVLDGAGVPWMVVGGVAARVHGARREHVDIDILCPMDALDPVWALIETHRVSGPEPFVDEHWDLTVCALDHDGERIAIGDSLGAKVRDGAHGTWTSFEVDYAAAERYDVLGVQVPVMGIGPLIAYKRLLDRPGDRQDLAQLGPKLFALLTGGAGVRPTPRTALP